MTEILIKISDDDYEWMKMGSVSNQGMKRLYQAIKNGTSLPKGHGRLIDADVDIKGLSEMKVVDEKDKQSVRFATIVLENAPTIIEADNEEG